MPQMSKNLLSCHLVKLSVKTLVVLFQSLVGFFSTSLHFIVKELRKVSNVVFIVIIFHRALICFTSVFDCRKARRGENGSIHS